MIENCSVHENLANENTRLREEVRKLRCFMELAEPIVTAAEALTMAKGRYHTAKAYCVLEEAIRHVKTIGDAK